MGGGRKPRKRRLVENLDKKRSRSSTSLSTGSFIRREDEKEDEEDANASITTKRSRKGSRKTAKKSTAASSSCSTACALTLREYKTRLVSAESELTAARDLVKEKDKQCRILVRKFDKRFDLEKVARRQWLQEKSRLTGRVVELECQNSLREAQLVQSMQDKARVMAILYPAEAQSHSHPPSHPQLHPQLHPSVSVSSGTGTGMAHSQSAPLLPLLPASPLPSSGAAFCVVCQDHTADTLLLPCSHMCLCHKHAVLMQANHQLDTCPLCKEPCSQVCRAR